MTKKILELAIGGFLPPLIDLINANIEDSKTRYVISIGVCLILGAVLNIGRLSLQNFLQTGALVFASAQTVYKVYWKTSKHRTETHD